MDIRALYRRLFEEEVRAWPLALCRIAIGLAVAWEATANVHRVIQYTPGQFHVSYVDVIQGLSPETYVAVCEWQWVFGLVVAAGVLTRLAAAAALGCQGYLFLISALNFRNHIYLMLLLLLLLTIFRSDRVLSVHAAGRWGWRKVVGDGEETVGWFSETIDPALTRLIQFQILIVYGWAAIHKMHAGYLNGYPLSVALEDVVSSGWSAEILASYPAWRSILEGMVASSSDMAAMSLMVVVGEALVALTLGSRAFRWLGIGLGVGLHATIAVGLDVYTFGALMVASYPLFAVEPPGGKLAASADR